MTITPVDRQKLDSIFTTYGPKFAGRKEDYFAFLYLAKKFRVEPDEIAHQVAFGGNDYGIDAYYIDRRAGNLYLFQFKWSEGYSQFKASMERLATDGMTRIFGNPLQDR